MKLLLLCLGLTLVCADYEENHEVVRSNFDMSKKYFTDLLQLSGFWYTILLASDVKEKIEEKGSFRLFLEYVRAFGNNSLFLKYHKKANGECTELNAVSHETVEEGVYSINYDGYTMFHIVEAVYDDYFIFYNLNSNEEETTQVLEFSARDPDVSPQLKKRFEELCQQFGIPKENVVDLTNDDRCIQARWSYGAQASRYIVGLYSSVSKYGWQKARIYSSAV